MTVGRAAQCTIAGDIEADLFRRWMEAGAHAFEAMTLQTATHADRLEAQAEEVEAHARYLRFKLAVLRVREMKGSAM